MKKRAVLLIAMVFLSACAPSPLPPPMAEHSEAKNLDSQVLNSPQAQAQVDTRHFLPREAYQAASVPESERQAARAVIVPHHGPAMGLAARAIAGLAHPLPVTVILLAPNHTAAGPRVATTDAAFLTWDGPVRAQTEIVSALVSQGLASPAGGLFETEHSAGAVMPLVARYLPGAAVVPLLFQKGVPLGDALRVLEAALALAGPRTATLVIASVDFSHGLPAQEELRRRETTAGMIERFDAAAVAGLDETSLDAPAVLAALLRAMQGEGRGVRILAGVNTAGLLGTALPEVTGYMTAYFY